MKFPLPIQVSAASSITVTQPFGITSNTLEPVGPNGEPHFHYGLDIVCGDDHATFGAELRWPFPSGAMINRSPQPQGSTQTPFLQLEYKPTDGVVYNSTFAHCSEIEPEGTFQYGALVGKIGNIGLVRPQPPLKDPYAGAHLHLGLQADGKWVDPALYFDLTKPFIGTGPDQEDQLPATNWLIQELLALLKPYQSQTAQ
jgi:hypothetical protein